MREDKRIQKNFEISDIYQIKNNEVFNEKVLALIVSGRMGKKLSRFLKKLLMMVIYMMY